MKKKYIFFSSAPAILLLSAVLFVEHSFNTIQVTPFYDGCMKIWGHQGHNTTHEESPLERFRSAFDSGAEGIEFNVVWDVDLKTFTVPHKYTYVPENMGLLTLEEVFKAIGQRGYFWLDLKNLKDLDKADSAAAAKNMSFLLERFDLKDKVIVESKMAARLTAFSKRGMHTCLWITPGRENTRIATWLRMFPYKIMFLMGNFSAFSMNYVNYTPHVQEILHQVPVHLFTVNNESEIMKYIRMPNVRIVLSDRTSHFSLNSCNDDEK